MESATSLLIAQPGRTLNGGFRLFTIFRLYLQSINLIETFVIRTKVNEYLIQANTYI